MYSAFEEINNLTFIWKQGSVERKKEHLLDHVLAIQYGNKDIPF